MSLSLTLECNDADSCVVYFEPLGTDHVLHRGDLFRIEIEGDPGEQIEIVHSPDSLTIGIFTEAVKVTNRGGEVLKL